MFFFSELNASLHSFICQACCSLQTVLAASPRMCLVDRPLPPPEADRCSSTKATAVLGLVVLPPVPNVFLLRQRQSQKLPSSASYASCLAGSFRFSTVTLVFLRRRLVDRPTYVPSSTQQFPAVPSSSLLGRLLARHSALCGSFLNLPPNEVYCYLGGYFRILVCSI